MTQVSTSRPLAVSFRGVASGLFSSSSEVIFESSSSEVVVKLKLFLALRGRFLTSLVLSELLESVSDSVVLVFDEEADFFVKSSILLEEVLSSDDEDEDKVEDILPVEAFFDVDFKSGLDIEGPPEFAAASEVRFSGSLNAYGSSSSSLEVLETAPRLRELNFADLSEGVDSFPPLVVGLAVGFGVWCPATPLLDEDLVEVGSDLEIGGASISLPLSSITGIAAFLAFRPRLLVLVGDKSSEEVVEATSIAGLPPSSFSTSTSSFSLSASRSALISRMDRLLELLPLLRFWSEGEDGTCC